VKVLAVLIGNQEGGNAAEEGGVRLEKGGRASRVLSRGCCVMRGSEKKPYCRPVRLSRIPLWLSVPTDHTEGGGACVTGLQFYPLAHRRVKRTSTVGAVPTCASIGGERPLWAYFSDLAPLTRPSIRPLSSAQAARLVMLPLLLVKAGRWAMALCFAAEQISHEGRLPQGGE
jgi:hypothetical protein